MITKTKLTSHVKTQLSSVTSFYHFLDKEVLTFNPSHILMSRRKLLSSEEKKKFTKELNVPLGKIPSVVGSSDISCRYFGALPGDVFREIRDSVFPESINDSSVSYRYLK
jgi:DNA-directed RNA polymerase subunit H (RpoH/RPB5)